MNFDAHLIIREIFKWGTKGKNLDQDIQYILLKDIEDDHLENIIKWINKYPESYGKETLITMENEKIFRLKQIRLKKLKKLNEKY